jgi:hypothetical protein
MTNVIPFPLDRRQKEQEDREWDEIVEQVRIIDERTEMVVTELMEELLVDEPDIVEDKYLYDVSFVYECVRSLLLKQRELHHPIQALASNIYEADNQSIENPFQYEFDF